MLAEIEGSPLPRLDGSVRKPRGYSIENYWQPVFESLRHMLAAIARPTQKYVHSLVSSQSFTNRTRTAGYYPASCAQLPRETVWKIRIRAKRGSHEAARGGEEILFSRFVPPKNARSRRPQAIYQTVSVRSIPRTSRRGGYRKFRTSTPAAVDQPHPQ